MKKTIIKNLKAAEKNIRRSGKDPTAKNNIWHHELIWIQDAIRYLESNGKSK